MDGHYTREGDTATCAHCGYGVRYVQLRKARAPAVYEPWYRTGMYEAHIGNIVAIAAHGADRVIGRDNQLLWHIPDDLKHFKQLTMGHPVIMGRKTFQSVLAYLGKPLPGRDTIVLTRDPSYAFEGVVVAHSIEEALAKGRELQKGDVYVCGGAEVYAQALPYTDVLELTVVDASVLGDAFFPPYETEFTSVVSSEEHEHDGVHYRFERRVRNGI